MALKILIVEDDAVNRHYLVELLSGLGHACVSCRSLRDARMHLATEGFALTIADWRLPDGYGHELRGSPGLGRLLLVSGDPPPDQSYADCWLQKPIEPGRLLSMLGSEAATGLTAARPEAAGAILDDGAAARALGAGKATLEGLRRLLAGELERELPLLEAAVAAVDWTQISARCHRLRAAAALCGASRLAKACAELERAPANVPALTSAWRRLSAEAEALLDRLDEMG